MKQITEGQGSAGWVAGLGALVCGFLLYAALAGMGGGIDWHDRLTFGQGGDLGFEGVSIFVGFVAGAVVGAPLGAYIGLRWTHAPRAGITFLYSIPATAALTTLAVVAIPAERTDPVLLPYGIFGAWFLGPLLTRLFVERDGPSV